MPARVHKHSNRPINLNLLRFHFPITAVTSIAHRITGVLLFLGFWLLLYLLQLALQAQGGVRLNEILDAHWGKGAIAVLAGCACFHLVAGVKHLLLDIHIGESFEAARMFCWITWFISAVLTSLAAYSLWW